jgi:hypothetical protein
MPNRIRGVVSTAVLFITIALSAIFAAQTLADSAGAVHFVRMADSSFDQYTSKPSPEQQAWLRAHVWRMGVWSPYFDAKTSWYPNGWVYDDSYAIYNGGQLSSQHPEWILKDAHGNPLYIPFGCSGGTCPQYAADITNPDYRQSWINNLKAELAHGYKGVFVDDVNMNLQVGNGQEEHVAPIDPSTGQPMTENAWSHYMAHFMAEIRAALPASVEIVHNAIWFAGEDAGTTNPDIKSEISSANYIYLERGVNDSGLTGGNGRWSLNSFFSYIDQIHTLGKGVVLDGKADDPKGLEYNLAAYFLISTGNDAVSGGEQTPTNWWAGWNTNLGEATGPRYTWNNLLRRDYTGGIVLLDPPGAPTCTITLSTPMQTPDGTTHTTITLTAATGVILTNTTPNTEPTPTLTLEPTLPTPEPLQTQTHTPTPPTPTSTSNTPESTPVPTIPTHHTPPSSTPITTKSKSPSHRHHHSRRIAARQASTKRSSHGPATRRIRRSPSAFSPSRRHSRRHA